MVPTSDTHQPPKNSAALVAPDTLWVAVFRYLGVDDKEVALVSQQFLAAWRAGVVGLYVHIPTEHPLSFLLDDCFNTFPNLKFVSSDSSSCTQFRHPEAREVALAQPGINLRLKLTDGISLNEMAAFFAQHANLANAVTHVQIESARQTFAQAWALISLLPNLTNLQLQQFQDLTNDQLRNVCRLPSLRQLTVIMCNNLTGEALDAMAHQDCGIESLAFIHCDQSGHELQHLLPNPKLKRLILSGNNGATRLYQLHPQPALKVLSLCYTDLPGSSGLEQLVERLPQLEVLDIAYCGDITDEGLAKLAKLQQLRRLDITCCFCLSEQAVHQLAAQLPELVEISIHSPQEMTRGPVGAPRNAKGQLVAMTPGSDFSLRRARWPDVHQ